MNVFARELGLPSNSLKKSLQVLEEGFIKEVDLVRGQWPCLCADGGHRL